MRSADRTGYIKIATGLILLACVAGGALWLVSIQPVYDDRMCRVDQPPSGQVKIIVDLSEAADGMAIPGLIRGWRDQLAMDQRLSVYRIGDLGDPIEDQVDDLWPLI